MTFTSEELAFLVDALGLDSVPEELMLIRDHRGRELGQVADLMDDWTRLENQAYHQCLIKKNAKLDGLEARVAQLENQLSDYITRLNRFSGGVLNAFPGRVILDRDGIPDFVPLYNFVDLVTDEELTDLSDVESLDLLMEQ